jgi:hypothetical protein
MNSKVSQYTSSLFATPSFFSGAARVLDLGGTFDVYDASSSPEEADVRALKSDWCAVGHDMEAAIDQVTK